MRVLSRLLLIENDITVPRTKRIFENVIMDLIDHQDPSSFNQGLMELGATICTPKPKCLLCPVRDYCAAFDEGRQEELPVRTKKKKGKVIPMASFAIQNDEGKWLLRKRPKSGLLADMWEFPMVELSPDKKPENIFYEQFGLQLDPLTEIIAFKHIFTHLTWEMSSFRARITEKEIIPEGYQFLTEVEVESLPKPVPVVKIWESIKNGGI